MSTNNQGSARKSPSRVRISLAWFVGRSLYPVPPSQLSKCTQTPTPSFYCFCWYQHTKHWRRAEETAQQVTKNLATQAWWPECRSPEATKSQARQCMSVNSALVWQGGRQRQGNPCSCCLPISAQRPTAQESPLKSHQCGLYRASTNKRDPASNKAESEEQPEFWS